MGDTYNDEESMHGTTLEKEYDATFDGDEKTSALLKLTSDAFTRSYGTVKLSQVGITEPIKRSRFKTMTGLTSTVKDMGVLEPIHVMKVAEESADDDYQYILLSGLRRMYGAMRNGISELDAIIWDFKDKDQGADLALFLSLFLNRRQKYDWGETWDLYKILEMQSAITPGTLEYLLQLESGDAMKLKDVMLCDYEEVKMALINGEKNLEGAYKMLQKLRKEENKLAMEDAKGVGDTVEGAEDLASDNTGESGQLSEQDVLELLEMVDSMDEDSISSEDFGELNQSAFGDTHQKVGERHPVDPAIKQGTLQRDNFKCRCCGTGGVAFLGVLVYHHIIPVSCHGGDTIDNGLTLCSSCHIQLHVAEKSGGRIPMTEEQFNEYDEETQTRIKSILKYAKIAVEAHKRCGNSRDKIIEEANKSARHLMPGEGLKDNQRGFIESQKNQNNKSSTEG